MMITFTQTTTTLEIKSIKRVLNADRTMIKMTIIMIMIRLLTKIHIMDLRRKLTLSTKDTSQLTTIKMEARVTDNSKTIIKITTMIVTITCNRALQDVS